MTIERMPCQVGRIAFLRVENAIVQVRVVWFSCALEQAAVELPDGTRVLIEDARTLQPAEVC